MDDFVECVECEGCAGEVSIDEAYYSRTGEGPYCEGCFPKSVTERGA